MTIELAWILLALRLLGALLLYTFLGSLFYLIWRDLKAAQHQIDEDQDAP